MWQEDAVDRGEILRFALFQPENFRSGPAGQHSVADQLDQRGFASEFLNDFSALCRRRGIAPKFSRPNHLTGRVTDDQAMLLATDSDGANLMFPVADLGQTILNRLVHGADPNLGILLHVPLGQTSD